MIINRFLLRGARGNDVDEGPIVFKASPVKGGEIRSPRYIYGSKTKWRQESANKDKCCQEVSGH
jgi:hypothetical protein